MKTNQILLSLAVMAMMTSCHSASKPQGDTGKNALDWSGVYSGVLPCASCPGIQTVIQLNGDSTYRLQTDYVDQDGTPVVKEGSFTWNTDENAITLSGFEAEEGSNRFLVGENQLIHLNMENERITGELADQYILKKTNAVVERYWKLVEIGGTAVTSTQMDNEAHIVFSSFENRFYGSTGCNSFFGQYQLTDGQSIAFSQAGSTRMMCAEMSVEDQLLPLFGQTVLYVLNENQLWLKDSNGNLLAKFELAKMK